MHARGFDDYRQALKALMRRASSHFQQQAWSQLQADAVRRLEMRRWLTNAAIEASLKLLGDQIQNREIWAEIKKHFAILVMTRPDRELAETFFSSTVRRIFALIGVDNDLEFTDQGATASDVVPPSDPLTWVFPVSRGMRKKDPLRMAAEAMLKATPFKGQLQDRARDARQIAKEIRAVCGERCIESLETLKPIFYRGKGAYLVGRVLTDQGYVPLVVIFFNQGAGVFVDAVLLTENEVSIIFSFTRSYFHVEADHAAVVVLFLKSIMPRKRIAELYISLGYTMHGKTEIYRDVMRYLAETNATFSPAPGDRGMVMAVFTLPDYDLVFKVIRDQFAYPKTTTRADVLSKYSVVFKHDRAGRLVDAQEFRDWVWPRSCFSPEVLKELTDSCASSIELTDEYIRIRHFYVERRVTPLNLYLDQGDEVAIREAVMDFGQAIKDLAATNIFPGDMLLKNFGVTRHRRVIFYDYDELCLVTDCKFRDLPEAENDEDDWRGEAWFFVAEDDIFPEEFLTFMGLHGLARDVFLQTHSAILTPDFWRKMQARLRAGEVIEIFPYSPTRSLHGLPGCCPE